MAFTYDISTDIGKVRSLIRDITESTAVFSDEEITVFLSLEANVILNAAALCLETVAGDTVRSIGVGQLLDIKADGAKMSDALLAVAARFRERADEIEDNSWAGFELAEQVDNSDFAYTEKVWKDMIAGL